MPDYGYASPTTGNPVWLSIVLLLGVLTLENGPGNGPLAQNRFNSFDHVVGCLIGSRPCKSTKGVMGFPWSPHLPPSQKNSRRNRRNAMFIPVVGRLEIWRAITTKRRAQNKPLVCHPVRCLNLERNIIQETHDVSGIVPGVRTHALGCRHQEMHHCANEVATLEILWVYNCAHVFCLYIYGHSAR